MNEEKFTGKADIYDKYRPSYPAELIEWLWENTHAENVADIGAGTGKFTDLLLKKDWRVTAVEPNADMLGKLRVNLPNIEIVNASAENTGITPNSIDLVTTATAFHWFDEERFKAECKRILTPEGRLAIVFNGKITDDIVKERDEISRIYCGYKGHAGKRSHEEGDAFLRSEYFSEVLYTEFDFGVSYDEEGFIKNTLSRSYALRPEDAGYDGYVCELKKLFNEYSEHGTVRLNYKTACYLGRF